MVISGPNTGGKTVALKTLGVAVLMAQAGLPVAASAAHLPLFGRVLADIGDQQSIEANLSTFSAHIVNIRSMMEVASPNDLVLLDEIGSSTEPNEGAALGIAILEHFGAAGSMTFVTTHHSRLKAYAAEAIQAVNAAMEFDEQTLRPTYRVLVGLPGKSSALAIASRLGLSPQTVERARALLPSADAEAAKLIGKLHDQQAELERQTALLEQGWRDLKAREVALERQFQQERRTRLRELDARLEQTIREIESRLEKTIADLRARQETAEAARRLSRKLPAIKSEAREEWNAQVLEVLGAPPETRESKAPSPPEVGDRVRISSLATPGTVVRRVDDNLEVEVGRMRMRVPANDVRVIGQRQPATTEPLARSRPSGSVPEELNVIGNTAEEARERVDKFLDQAYLAGCVRVRIVHGHGKGILRKSLHEMLATHPHVEKFEAAPAQEGGAGATIVELKI
jgi:DNA mismatch repair protein MutS2